MSEYKPTPKNHTTSQEDVKIEIIDRISTHSEKVASSLRCCSSNNSTENNNSSYQNQNNSSKQQQQPSTPAPVLKLGVQNKHSLTVPTNHQTNSSQFQTTNTNNSDENNTTTTSTPRTKEKKLGHRRVDTKTGLVTYKRQPHDLLGCAMQLGIVTTLSNNKQNATESNRDILIEDFQRVEKLNFTESGSELMPAHEYGDFQFKIYAPNAFRYFRQLFGIKEDDFLASIGEPKNSALISMSNPGASGSLFWRTHDDEFIIKTVQKDEAKFLRDLLPGYYMNLNQNPRSLLPKFYGLYLIKTSNHKNIRLMVMNNLIPTSVPIHLKYDLKGSTLGRNASERELQKSCPVLKDNDWTSKMPDGIYLDHDIYDALLRTMERDCRVLHSFKIMDYSLLLAIYNLDKHKDTIRESTLERKQQNNSIVNNSNNGNNPIHKKQTSTLSEKNNVIPEDVFDEIDESDKMLPEEQETLGKIEKTWRDRHGSNCASPVNKAHHHNVYNKNTPRISKYNTATGQIMASTSNVQRRLFDEELNHWSGGIPAFTSSGQRLLLYIGVIDILQHYKFKKKVEHHMKSLIYDGKTVSVCKPSYYKIRFEAFMKTAVFRQKKKDPNARSMPNLQGRTGGGGLSRNQMSSLPRHIIHASQNLQTNNNSGSVKHTPPIIQVQDSSESQNNTGIINSSNKSSSLAGSSVKTTKR